MKFDQKLFEGTLTRLARLPLPVRRPLFRAAWSALPKDQFGSLAGWQGQFETTMRYSQRDARRLAAQARYYDVLALVEWAQFRFRSLDTLLQSDAQLVRFTNEDALARLAAEGRGLILAPLHMGAYVLSLARIMQKHFQGRRVLIFTRQVDDGEGSNILRRLGEVGCDVRLVGVNDKAAYVDALRFARRDAVIICFVDLPAAYGVPAETSLFSKPARLGLGVDTLARACNAPIVPLSMNSFLRFELVKVGQPFEVKDPSPEERQRVVSLVCRHIETSVREAPAQWHLWPRFNEFKADYPGGIAA